MRVHLGVQTAAGVLPEHPHHDPFGVDAHHMALSPHPRVGLGLDPAQHCVHGPVMGLGHLTAELRVADAEEHRHRLRRRERRIEPSNRGVPEPATQIRSGRRVLSSHHRQKRLVDYPTGETQPLRAPAPPPPGRFTTIEVVRRQLFGVIRSRRFALERRHPHRHSNPPAGFEPQVCTRLSSPCKDLTRSGRGCAARRRCGWC